jgi:hypothetical protein
MKMESALRPRDIQSRIRAGESAEEVAEAAGTTVDAIMGFAAPVLAERAHVAESAQRSSIRRRSTEASTAAGTLDQAARAHLSDLGVRADDVDRDAWRRDDGRWTVVASYSAQGAELRAEFVYDQPGRYVVADNQEARLLTGEATPAPTATRSRRLSSVPDDRARFDDELPLADHELGDDALELVRDRGDADWIARAADTGADAPVKETVDPNDNADDNAEEDARDVGVDEAVDDAAHDSGNQARDAEPVDRAPAKTHKKGRSSVPSWDEIMFGGGKVE